MAKKPEVSLLDLWSAALEVEVGIAISTDDAKLLQQQLYRERSKAGIAELENLVIIMHANGEVWIVRKDAQG